MSIATVTLNDHQPFADLKTALSQLYESRVTAAAALDAATATYNAAEATRLDGEKRWNDGFIDDTTYQVLHDAAVTAGQTLMTARSDLESNDRAVKGKLLTVYGTVNAAERAAVSSVAGEWQTLVAARDSAKTALANAEAALVSARSTLISRLTEHGLSPDGARGVGDRIGALLAEL